MIAELQQEIQTCRKCELCNSTTLKAPADGHREPKLMVIGEALGETETLCGRPFMGQAGKILDKWLTHIGFERNNTVATLSKKVVVTNIIKCRPPNNRKPLVDEIAKCLPYLHRELEIYKPEWLLLLGATAANTILNNKLPMRDLVGKAEIVEINENIYKTFTVYHPAALLYDSTKDATTMMHLLALKEALRDSSKK